MAILGSRSYNGPLNASDIRASGAWSHPYTLTGTGVDYGAPGQYRSLMRVVSLGSSSNYPFIAGDAGISTVIPMGNVQDLYDAGGFWLGFTAASLRSVNEPTSDGDDIFWFTNIGTAWNSADYVRWNSVTNTPINIAASAGVNSLTYSMGTHYMQIGSTGWASGTSIPGTFTYTPYNISGTGLSFRGFLPPDETDPTYYCYGYVFASGYQARIWSSATGEAGTWTQRSVSGIDIVTNMYRFNGVAYALVNSSASTNASYISRWNGTTFASVSSIAVNYGYRCMAYNGTTLVAAGSNGNLYSSSDNGLTWTARTTGTTAIIMDVKWTGTEFVAWLSSTDILYSEDGLTWTFKERDLFPQSGAPSVQASGIFVTTKGTFFVTVNYVFQWDTVGKTWKCIRAASSTILANGTVTKPSGFFFGNGTSPTEPITNGRAMCGFVQYSSRLDAVGTTNTAAWTTRAVINSNAFPYDETARYEMSATSVPGQSVPTFDVRWIYNGTPVGTVLQVTALNATQTAFFTTAGTGHCQWYDILWGDMSGTRGAGPMGNARVLPKLNTQDVGTPQWEKVPADIATNALAASGNGSLTQPSSSVQSSAVDDLDEYTGPATEIPAGWKVSALQVSAGAQRLGIPTPTVELGVIDNGNAMPVATANLTGTTTTIVPLNKLYETSSNGEPWTAASLATSTVAVKRTE